MCCDSSPPSSAPPDAAAGAGLAVFDLDGTITRFDTLTPFLLGYLWRSPWRLLRLPLTLPAAVRFLFARDARGAFKGALVHAALGGLSRAALARWRARFIPWLLHHGIHAQALAAIERHRSHSHRLVLMSASPDLYVPQIAAALGFQDCVCTAMRWRPDGRLDGHLAGPNCRGEEKRRRLATLIERLAPGRVYTYGNSEADLPHMRLAQEAYLVNGPRRLKCAATAVRRLRWQD